MDMDLKKVDQGKVKAFFMFDILVLPWLVKIGFIVGVVGILLSGVSLPFRMAAGYSKFDFSAFVVGCVIAAVTIPLGLVGLRIVCESSLILFKIHEALVPKKPFDPAQGKPEEPKAAGPEVAAGKSPEPPKPDAPSATP